MDNGGDSLLATLGSSLVTEMDFLTLNHLDIHLIPKLLYDFTHLHPEF